MKTRGIRKSMTVGSVILLLALFDIEISNGAWGNTSPEVSGSTGTW